MYNLNPNCPMCDTPDPEGNSLEKPTSWYCPECGEHWDAPEDTPAIEWNGFNRPSEY